MTSGGNKNPAPRVFGLADWVAWMDKMARALFQMSGDEFEVAYIAGLFVNSGPAQDLGAMLPLIKALRERESTVSGTLT